MSSAVDLSIGSALARVRDTVSTACERAGRSPEEVLLVGVTKGVPLEHMRAAARLGLRDMAENRVSEAEAKFRELGPGVTRHFVGRIQSNKAGKVVRFADWVHSVDRSDVARRMDERAGRPIRALIQINVSGEPAKAGVAPDAAMRVIEELVGEESSLSALAIEGLMTMAPQSYDAGRSRPYFRRLARLRDELQQTFPSIRHLSMGMSQDYEVAIEEGATMVRLGRAIFEGSASR